MEFKILGKKLLDEYLKEQEEKNSNRIIRVISTFRFFHSDDEEMIKKMMVWAYNKGKDKKNEINTNN